jgi:hypothetical protein
VFAEIRKRERKALAALSAELGPDFNGRDAAIAIAALDRLVGALAPISEEGDDT